MSAAALLAVASASCTYKEIRPSIAQQESARADVQQFGPVSFQELAPGIWQHTAYLDVPGFGAIPTNGLVVADGETSLLVDTAWTDQQTEAIIGWARAALNKPIRAAVVTHAHKDKMGGMNALHDAGVATYALAMTNSLAAEKNLTPAQNDITLNARQWATGDAAQVLAPLKIYYPGGGHTADNITVGIAGTRIAFGGCLIKGSGAKSLGNLADADTQNYAATLSNFAVAFPDATIIAMSHSEPEGREAIDRSLKLAKDL
ncbi:subclass B1 metallo-beta-lactamase [Pontixanthobacter sp.]|uniref:subclass B1 metallo-beta-lactamase n=1 Tax=Pontixanthobacter sp. TaxID=2792078 RepID=UPI003C79B60F